MNETVEYVVDSSLWSVGGLLLGLTLGRIESEVHQLYRKVVKGEDQE